jgi:hypothetical protein
MNQQQTQTIQILHNENSKLKNIITDKDQIINLLLAQLNKNNQEIK